MTKAAKTFWITVVILVFLGIPSGIMYKVFSKLQWEDIFEGNTVYIDEKEVSEGDVLLTVLDDKPVQVLKAYGDQVTCRVQLADGDYSVVLFYLYELKWE